MTTNRAIGIADETVKREVKKMAKTDSEDNGNVHKPTSQLRLETGRLKRMKGTVQKILI